MNKMDFRFRCHLPLKRTPNLFAVFQGESLSPNDAGWQHTSIPNLNVHAILFY